MSVIKSVSRYLKLKNAVSATFTTCCLLIVNSIESNAYSAYSAYVGLLILLFVMYIILSSDNILKYIDDYISTRNVVTPLQKEDKSGESTIVYNK